MPPCGVIVSSSLPQQQRHRHHHVLIRPLRYLYTKASLFLSHFTFSILVGFLPWQPQDGEVGWQ